MGRLVLFAVAWLAVSCTGGDPALDGGAADAQVDARPDAYCHVDCFGHTECRDSRVTKWVSAPVPCEIWTGQCPIERTLLCTQGCLVNGVDLGPSFMNLSALCRETPPRVAGDPCMAYDDCLPTPATVSADGTLTNTYLRCDLAMRRCVAADPPSPAEWLTACVGVDLTPFRGTGQYGSTEALCGGSGVCLFADDTSAGCVKQGCSLACTGDQDCPPGAICSDQLSYWYQGQQRPNLPVCKPGGPSVIGAGLSCF